MPNPPDNPEPKNTHPQPELNPLLNPLLGAHMGRWAEVYFTNPPERRDEAVIELLRELVAEAEPVFPGNARTPSLISRQNDDAFESCPSCGVWNPHNQKFCGMCGAEMQSTGNAQGAASDARPPIDKPEPNLSWRLENANDADNDWKGSVELSRSHYGNGWKRDSWGNDQAVDQGPKLVPDYEPASYRHRVLVGAALAVLVSALVYMAWRTQAGLGTSQSIPSAAPATASEPSAQPPAEEASRTVIPAPPIRKNPAASSTAKPAPVAAIPAAEGSVFMQGDRGNGSEELAIAETYLTGAQGKARDEGEAAKWLWKSVGKQNATAALLLSDLYLRGSGVSKSCDQARLLLDAAARKGTRGAAERLRNLQAFGCQ